MNIFVTGTDTNVGKTLISTWLAIHTGFSYFKPIQTGNEMDSETVRQISHNTKIYSEIYTLKTPASPHLAAEIEGRYINMSRISLPSNNNCIVEGAGGLIVPINNKHFMVDLIKYLQIPVLLVTRSSIGTINHTLLSIEALRARHINVLGIIMNGDYNSDNRRAIEFYGQVPVLAEIPTLSSMSHEILKAIPLPIALKMALNCT